MAPKLSRRSFVTVAGGALAALAGCARSEDAGQQPGDEADAPADTAPEPEEEPQPEAVDDAASGPDLPTASVLSSLRYHQDDMGYGERDTFVEATYDDQGRMVRKVLETTPFSLVIDYDHDEAGRVVEAVVTEEDEWRSFAGTWTCAWSDDGQVAVWDYVPAEGGLDVAGHLEVSYNDEGNVVAKRGTTLGPQNHFQGSASYTYGPSGQVESVEQHGGEPMSQYEQSWTTWLYYDAAGRLSGYRDVDRGWVWRWQYDDDNNLAYLESRVQYGYAVYAEEFVPGGDGVRFGSRSLLSGNYEELASRPPADATLQLDDEGRVELATIRLGLGAGAVAECEVIYQDVPCADGVEPQPVASLLDPLAPAPLVDEWMWLDDYPLFGVDEALRANRRWLASHADEVKTILENRAWVRGSALETGDMNDARLLYAQPIGAYSQATGGYLDWSSNEPSASYLALGYASQIGEGGFEYAFAELPGYGSPVMLVRPTRVQTMDIWVPGGETPVLAVAGGFFEGEPQRVELCEDGYVITSGASGLAPQSWTLSRLDGPEAVAETTIYGDDASGFMQMDRVSSDETSVSPGEYLRLYAKHPTLLGLKWIAIDPPVG